ncbi:MAG: hypothetical protein JSU72_14330 [Deltaproteobacteria bacterium]|nr:MAG: hypothetical protein JSU72_14330 [Deltaproteobacteria bacterium]
MEPKDLHITDLFKQFAEAQAGLLRQGHDQRKGSASTLLTQLLHRFPLESDTSQLRHALVDPYFPVDVLVRTLFADVGGMRFFISKRRPELVDVLIGELRQWCTAFRRIQEDIRAHYDPDTITCIPLDGVKHQLPTDQWCTLCGVCCQIGGIPPEPPTTVHYPERWHIYLAGGAMDNQQVCPFLFQYFGESRFFCAIHNVKPLACRQFDQQDCRRRLSGRDLHLNEPTHS